MNQQTIAKKIFLEGVGLHTGKSSAVTLLPAGEGSGITFLRGDTRIPALIEYCDPTDRHTCLVADGERILTPEHLLSAAYALGVDNLTVSLDGGEELPAFDGSAAAYCRALADAGIVGQSAQRDVRAVGSHLEYEDPVQNVRILANPAETLRVVYHLNLAVKKESAAFCLDSGGYGTEIAPARTFCLASELLSLHDLGLVRGVDSHVGFVINDGKGPKDLGRIQKRFRLSDPSLPLPELPEKTRFANEAARHKILDFLGDLSLLGIRILGEIEIWHGGHKSNQAFVRLLHAYLAQKQGLSRSIGAAKGVS